MEGEATEEVQIEVSMSKSGEGEVTVTSPSSLLQQQTGNFTSHPSTNHQLPPPLTTAPTMPMSNHHNHHNHNIPNTNVGMGIDKSDSMLMKEQKEEEEKLTSNILNESVEMDLSVLRGIQPPPEDEQQNQQLNKFGGGSGKDRRGVRLGFGSSPGGDKNLKNNKGSSDLEALAELVPGLKTGQVGPDAVVVTNSNIDHGGAASGGELFASPEGGGNGNNAGVGDGDGDESDANRIIPQIDSMAVNQGESTRDILNSGNNDHIAAVAKMQTLHENMEGNGDHHDDDYSDEDDDDDDDDNDDKNNNASPQTTNDLINTYMAKPFVKEIGDESESSDDSKSTAAKTHSSGGDRHLRVGHLDSNRSKPNQINNNINNNINPYERYNHNNNLSTPPRPSQDESMYGATPTHGDHFTHHSSAASISTATHTLQTNDMSRAPMLYLPTFRPATGCTNASDFIVRCFVARLRSGITVVKHGRSRWCKSRLRILHVHSDGRSLSWKPAQGEPNSSKRPPKLDLSTCLEVRHAWSPDPQNPHFTGTPNLRSKCDAGNAFKSFALIFPRRTVDITAVTADQCKVLMEGFSALCYRLQVANMVARGSRSYGGGTVSGIGGEGDKEGIGTIPNTSASDSMRI